MLLSAARAHGSGGFGHCSGWDWASLQLLVFGFPHQKARFWLPCHTWQIVCSETECELEFFFYLFFSDCFSFIISIFSFVNKFSLLWKEV